MRRYIGMVFQQPNPFSMSIFDNVAFGLRLNRFRGNMAERVEQALRQAALWDEVKDKLKKSGLSLSGGQQQRLCIARAIATEPAVLLMDEPCSALDPIATRRIEELMLELKQNYTIAIVTHNMQQAQRVADMTAFFSVDISKGSRTGYLVESGPTRRDLREPARAAHQGVHLRPVQLSDAMRRAWASRGCLTCAMAIAAARVAAGDRVVAALAGAAAAQDSRARRRLAGAPGRRGDVSRAALREVDPGVSPTAEPGRADHATTPWAAARASGASSADASISARATRR